MSIRRVCADGSPYACWPKDSHDFDAIRQELLGQIARYNSTKKDAQINFFENPITRFDVAIGSEGQSKVELKDYLMETGGLLLFLLLVPALNLLGVTQSSVQKRRSEMGVRKAFGATFGVLVRQVLYENCVITLLGGVLGLALSLSSCQLCKDFLLKDSRNILERRYDLPAGRFLTGIAVQPADQFAFGRYSCRAGRPAADRDILERRRGE